MKRLTVSVIAEDEEDFLAMVQTAMMQVIYTNKTRVCLATTSGFITWKVEDSKDRDMINFTMIEEKP